MSHADPFTGNRYTFGAGNPITNIELDGHMLTAATSSGCVATLPGCPGYTVPAATQKQRLPQPGIRSTQPSSSISHTRHIRHRQHYTTISSP